MDSRKSNAATMNPVKVVNTVWAGRTGFPMDLDVMRIMLNKHELVRRIDVQRATTIKQLKLSLHGGGVVLFFKSGAFRIMGDLDDINANFTLCRLLNEFCYRIPDIHLQTMTAVSSNSLNINLNKLSEKIPSHKRIYETELFPALQITLFAPIHVNVFSSGSVVLLGVKDLTVAQAIVDHLKEDILKSVYS
jgi:TATA-box binding protein (TBP) (component of TFIID and TFIIIB)